MRRDPITRLIAGLQRLGMKYEGNNEFYFWRSNAMLYYNLLLKSLPSGKSKSYQVKVSYKQEHKNNGQINCYY